MTDTFKTFGAEIRPLGYRPKPPYLLDLEIFAMADLRRRGSKENVRATHRYEFHTLVCVTRGVCTQVVDFKAIACAPGSLLVLRPGQAHSYGPDEDWEGWNVLFRPEFVLPVSTPPRDLRLAGDLMRLGEHMRLSGDELRTVTDAIQQMREDSRMAAPAEDVHALLRHQLHALLTRLSMLQGRQPAQERAVSPASQRLSLIHI